MQIQVNTGKGVNGTESLEQRVQDMVAGALDHFADRITRIEVHLTDENSTDKSGPADKRCLLEARLTGLQPIAVTHQADSMQLAIDGAADKLERAIGHTLGKLQAQ